MSEPTPEQQAGAAEVSAWPGGGFAAPGGSATPGGDPAYSPPAHPWSTPASYGSPGRPPPPPGYPPQAGYPPQPAYPVYPAQAAYPAQPGYPPPPGAQGYASAYPAPSYAGPGATTSSTPRSTVLLLLLSIVGIVTTGVIGIPSAVIAALAWRQNGADPVAARKRTTTGWVVFAVNFAVGSLALIAFYIWVSNNS